MGLATILWSSAAGMSLTLAVACAAVWATDRRSPAGLMLFLLGVAVAVSAYVELGLMHSTTVAGYVVWLRWYHVPLLMAALGQVLFVHYYLGTGRLWLLWTVIAARAIVFAVNFLVYPTFNFSSITGLQTFSLFGEPVSTIGISVTREGWQQFALLSLVLLQAYLVDAAIRRWRMGGRESRRRALAVLLGVVAPWLCTMTYTQLIVFGAVHEPVTNLFWFLGALLMMTWELGRNFVQSRRALVELAQLQHRLMQAERVSVLGQLTAALTHELAQPLSANAMNAAAALERLNHDKADLGELRAILADIGADSRRGIDLVARMRQFFKHHAIEMRPLRLEDVVQDVVALVGAEVTSRKVDLSLHIQQGLPLVSGDRLHLSQVLLNLVTNGIHAVHSRPPDARRVVVEARADNGKGEVEMTVRDSGPGIPDGVFDKVFDSFFTTKAEGMGMGLTLSQTIIEAHGGRLWAEDNPGRGGAIFHFTLHRA